MYLNILKVVSTKSAKSGKLYMCGKERPVQVLIRFGRRQDPEKRIPRGTCLILYLKIEVDEDHPKPKRMDKMRKLR